MEEVTFDGKAIVEQLVNQVREKTGLTVEIEQEYFAYLRDMQVLNSEKTMLVMSNMFNMTMRDQLSLLRLIVPLYETAEKLADKYSFEEEE